VKCRLVRCAQELAALWYRQSPGEDSKLGQARSLIANIARRRRPVPNVSQELLPASVNSLTNILSFFPEHVITGG
jgi:hypothetical protein